MDTLGIECLGFRNREAATPTLEMLVYLLSWAAHRIDLAKSRPMSANKRVKLKAMKEAADKLAAHLVPETMDPQIRLYLPTGIDDLYAAIQNLSAGLTFSIDATCHEGDSRGGARKALIKQQRELEVESLRAFFAKHANSSADEGNKNEFVDICKRYLEAD
ncbi:MAG: hypothetical protein NVS9B10_14990 [Nevskia sp.]